MEMKRSDKKVGEITSRDGGPFVIIRPFRSNPSNWRLPLRPDWQLDTVSK